MKALLIWPIFPETFWSFSEVLKLAGRKAFLPPLGLATVAALLPQDWEFRIIDRNFAVLGEDDWNWADIVLLSAMIVQKDDLLGLIREAKSRSKPVAVGGPYVTSVPDEAKKAGVDYLVMDEGEITIPAFLQHLEANGLSSLPEGAPAFTFRAKDKQKPEMALSPIPRFDLLDMPAYDGMSIQYSRGCPFLCEFCDIITLYGRKPRAKSPKQLIAELEYLRSLGRRGYIFLVDDNFIGNKRNVKQLLVELREWQRAHGSPFYFDTEASIDLAADPELIQLMVDCNFTSVFIGIETPDTESLALTRKHQNNRNPLIDSVQLITRAGLRVQCGLIIGFDGERKGAGQRIVQFIEATNIPTAFFSILQALPNTALWDRLEREGRLLGNTGDVNQTSVLNFIPTRPASDIVQEYVEAFADLYEPKAYLKRTYRYFLELGINKVKNESAKPAVKAKKIQVTVRQDPLRGVKRTLQYIRAFFTVCWRQGVIRDTRFLFWRYAARMRRERPELLDAFLVICAHNEHFLLFRERVRTQVLAKGTITSDIYSRSVTVHE